MSFATNVQNLATRIATECKSIRALVNGNAVDNAALITTAKGNLVAAINEVKAQANSLAASGGATINDASTSSTTQTYSIDKIRSELSSTAASVKNEILGGAGAAYDTLKELQDLLTGEQSAIDAINTALGNRLRVDVANQSLTTTQQANGRTNLDVYGKTEIGNPETDFTATFVAGLV
ncbi:hypothetical protein [Methylobacterium sp. CM6247]